MGISVGFVFALLAMMISVVSFPLLLDRDTGLDTAIGTSVPGGAGQSGADGAVGPGGGGGLLVGIGAGLCRPDGGGAGAGPCDLASLSQTHRLTRGCTAGGDLL